MDEQETQFIPIYYGDDTDFHNRTFVTVSIDTTMDLSGMTATLYLGQLKKDYSIVNNGFEIKLSSNETKTLPLGELYGRISLFDSSNRRRTISSEVPFFVSKKVADGSPISITLSVEEESAVAYVTTQMKAEQLAEEAETAATNAANSATAAATSATNAANSASAAASSATAAGTAKTGAETAESNASAHATNASSSASAAAQSATDAANSASQAASTLESAVHKTGNETVAGNKDFTGTLTAVTPADGDDSTKVATTAFVNRLHRGGLPVGADFGTSSATGTRTGDAEGMTFAASTTTTAGQNDFRNKRPEFQTESALFEIGSNGKPYLVAREGSSLYERLISDDEYTGHEFERFNKFYYKIARTVNDNGSYKVHHSPYSGFDIHPAFTMGGKERNHIYVARFKFTKDSSGAIGSQKNSLFYTNTSQANFQTLARAKGMIVAPIQVAAMIQLLAIIQANSLNSQAAYGTGQTDCWQTTKVSVAQTDANSVIVPKSGSTKFNTYRSLWCKNAYRRIISVEEYDTDNNIITINDTLTTAVNDDVYAGPNISGQSRAILGKDGYNNTLPSGQQTSIILGLEDVYGGPNCGVAGIERYGGTRSFISPDPVNLYEFPTNPDTDAKGWQEGPAMLTAEGWQKRFTADSEHGNHPWLFNVAQTGGSSSGPQADYLYTNTGTDAKMLYWGGNWSYGARNGLFYANLNNAVSNANWNNGARGLLLSNKKQ